MNNETDIIRGLVSQLSSVERDTDYGLHEPWPDEGNPCQCPLCTARQSNYGAKSMKWEPIETAPLGASGKPETYFIGARRDKSNGRISTATCYRNHHGAYEWWGGGLEPTHWMPIPEWPQAQSPIEEPRSGDTGTAEQPGSSLTQKIETMP